MQTIPHFMRGEERILPRFQLHCFLLDNCVPYVIFDLFIFLKCRPALLLSWSQLPGKATWPLWPIASRKALKLTCETRYQKAMVYEFCLKAGADIEIKANVSRYKVSL